MGQSKNRRCTMVDFRALVPWRERSQTPATRDDFLDPFVSFRREVNRMFDSFFDDFTRPSGAGWLTPAVDVAENDKELVITERSRGSAKKTWT
jgi:HSP20 family molecular chaperone IbpA